MRKRALYMLVSLLSIFTIISGCELQDGRRSVVAKDATIDSLAGGFIFTEGPASDSQGNVYFTDIPENKIYKLTPERKLETLIKNSGNANGLYFDKKGNLIACQTRQARIVSITMGAEDFGKITVLADTYDGKVFNATNDLWIDPEGGVYFTDPRYGGANEEQDGEHVYYILPDRSKVIRVIDDMVRPNGIIGTPDGKKLYVADPGADKTYKYTINPDGTLSNKKLFAEEGSDGMTIDGEGNIYITSDAVKVYNKQGELIESINVPERPSNVCFAGKDNRTLFITARTSIYSIRMRVSGAS